MASEAEQLYERDFYTWTQAQAQALRQAAAERVNSSAPVDWANVAQEIEDMGKRDLRELGSRFEVLLLHLLKWRFQPNARSGSWGGSIAEQRSSLQRLLKQSPGLKPHQEAEMEESYPPARRRAANETGLPLDRFPQACPFSLGEVMDDGFWPEAEPDAPVRG